MPTIFTGQGSVVFATSGAGRRVAISSVVNGTPVVVNATAHGFLYTDTVLIEGTGLTALDGKYFQLSSVSTNQFTLLGTTASGSSSSGYAIDYQLQPAIQVPAGGELADPNVNGAAIEGIANYVPFLYARTGKYRLYNEYVLTAGTGLPPFTSAWSTNSGFTSTSLVVLSGASATLASMSSQPSIPPVVAAGDVLEYSFTFTVGMVCGSGASQFANVDIGLAQIIGGSPTLLAMPATVLVAYNSSSISPLPFYTVTLSGAIRESLVSPVSTMAFGIGALVDNFNGGATSCAINLYGPWTGYVNQYRAN